jgi:hypothetical protein
MAKISELNKIYFYTPTTDTEYITTEIIKRCEKQVSEESKKDYQEQDKNNLGFKSIIPYKNDNPDDNEIYFHSKTAFACTGLGANDKRYIKTNLDFGIHYVKGKIKHDNKDADNMLTREGLMSVMYLGKNALAKAFQHYVFALLDGLWKHQKAAVLSEMKSLEKQLEDERNKRRDIELKNNENIHLQEIYYNDAITADPDKTELTIMQRQYLSTYYVYVADWYYINKKYWKPGSKAIQKAITKAIPIKKQPSTLSEYEYNRAIDLNNSSGDDNDYTGNDIINKSAKSEKSKRTKKIKAAQDINEPHPDGIEDSYELDFIDIHTLKTNDNDEYYIYIGPELPENKLSIFKFMTTIHLDKTKHYDEMINYLNNGDVSDKTAYKINSYEPCLYKNIDFGNIKTPANKVFKITYSMLESARSRSYITMNKELLIGPKKKK